MTTYNELIECDLNHDTHQWVRGQAMEIVDPEDDLSVRGVIKLACPCGATLIISKILTQPQQRIDQWTPGPI